MWLEKHHWPWEGVRGCRFNYAAGEEDAVLTTIASLLQTISTTSGSVEIVYAEYMPVEGSTLYPLNPNQVSTAGKLEKF